MAMLEQSNDILIERILKATKADQQGDNRYRGLCPAHDDHNPSLDIYVNADGYLGFNCLSRKCKTFEITKALKDKFDIDVPARRSSAASAGKLLRSRVVYPAHETQFPFNCHKADDIIYEYTTATGEPAFFVQRYEENGKKQTPAWFSLEHTSEDGQVRKEWSCKNPPREGRPIFNLYLLEHYGSRPVLVVEGEKTALAAMQLPQFSGYVVTTWSGGSKNVKASDWKPLKDRQTPIYFWPDHDEEGVGAMRNVAARISGGADDNRFFMLDYSLLMGDKINKGWDLADGWANLECDYAFEDLWEAMKTFYVEDMASSDTLEEALARRDKAYRKVHVGNRDLVVDTSVKDDTVFNCMWFGGPKDLMSYDAERIPVEMGKKVVEVSVAERWFETRDRKSKQYLKGVRFDPSTEAVEVRNEDGTRSLNTFPGFPRFGEGDDRLVEAFKRHLRGMIASAEAYEWLMDYIADMFQHPGVKPGTAVVFLGKQGTGKSIVVRILVAMLGARLSKIITKDLVNNNSALANSLMVYHDEWSIDLVKEKAYYDALKATVDGTTVHIREKYVPPYDSNSQCRFFFTSNSMAYVQFPPDDRRFTVIQCGDHWIRNAEHFKEMFAFLKDTVALAGLVKHFKERVVTRNVHQCLDTTLKQTLTTAESPVMREVMALAEGESLPINIVFALDHTKIEGLHRHAVLVPRYLFRDYLVELYGKNALNKAEQDLLNRLIPGPEYKRRMIIRERGGERSFFGLCYEIPEVGELRKRIEAEFGKSYQWEYTVEQLCPPLDDGTVVPFKKDEPL